MSGSNNFVQFDATKQNMASDATYNGSSIQLNGVPLVAVADPTLHNKMFYQWSTFISAFGNMLAARGYNVSDSDINALQAVLANLLTVQGGTMTGAINETEATLASASTVNIGAAAANFILITGNIPITSFDSIQAGTRRKLKFGSALTINYDAVKMILPNAANMGINAGDVVEFVSLGGGNWQYCGYDPSTFNYIPRGKLTLTISGIYTFTAPITGWYDILVIGAGGGGGGVASAGRASGGGGGAGAWGRKKVFLTAGDTVTCTVGIGGNGGIGTTTLGQSGATSSFGAYLSATGGAPGGNTANDAAGGGAGSSNIAGSDTQGYGGAGFPGYINSVLGYAGCGVPGSSLWCGQAYGGYYNGTVSGGTTGNNGTYGSGGWGACGYNWTGNGGKGGNGVIDIKW